ncbi:YhdP family phospholipid transporter [Wenzhouxiangella sp. EGI_FJ10409]|uniref:YhdP family phospholipid transporter n=1 Tax=Wenzhouxiangella sp. EGI_FJ10409 TaxID=3243767 RepID=UPI0035DDC7C5
MSERSIDKPASSARGILRRLRQWLAAIAAVVIIATAVIVGIGRLFIPYADELTPWLESQLSDRLGQPVTIERVQASWPRLTPRISLEGLRAGSGATSTVEVEQARLELHLPDLLRSDRNPFRLVLLGLDLVLAEDEAGQWGLRLEEGGRLSGDPGGGQALAGDLVVRDLELGISPQRGPRLDLVISEGELRRRGNRTALVARAHLAAAPEAALSLSLLGEQVAGRLQSLTGNIDLNRLRLEAPGLDRILPDFLNLPPDRLDADLAFDWHVDHGGSADLGFELAGNDGFDLGGALRVERRGRRIDAELLRLESGGRRLASDIVIAHDDRLWAAEVPELDLAQLHEVFGRWLSGWRRWPASLAGEVRDLELLYQHPGALHRLDGTVAGAGLNMPGDRLRLSGLDLDLGLAGDRAELSLSGSPVVDWPAKMRQPVPIETIEGRVVVSPGAVQLDGVVGTRPEARGRADGWVWLGGGRPFLDFRVDAERIAAVDPRPWLPSGQIPPKTLNWLDRALLGLSGGTGGLNYHFRLGHKFREWAPGDFQAWIDFRGADIDFWEDWPLARGLSGRVDFVGRSMIARVDSGSLGPVPVSAEQIAIGDLLEPEISIALAADEVDAGEVRTLLRDFPFEGWSDFVDPVSASGSVSIATELFLPLRRMAEWRLDGSAEFEGTTLGLPAANLGFPGLEGRVIFDREGLGPARLQLDGATEVEIEAGFESPAWLTLSGDLPPARLLPERAPWSALTERVDGSSQWQVRLDGHPDGGWQLEAASDLRGLALDMPPPLNKEAGEAMPLDLSLRARAGGMTISARLAQLLQLTAEDAEGRWRVAAGLGQSAPALPAENGFDVAGQVDRLDLAGWSEWFSHFSTTGGDGDGDARPGRVRIGLGQLDYGSFSLEEVELDAHREPSQWRMSLSGPSIEGDITLPMPVDSGRVLAVDLERVDLSRRPSQVPSGDLARAPVPGQTRTRVPTEFPPIHLLIESLRIGDIPLGRVRIESHARSEGIEIERIEVLGPHLELSGYGRWILAEAGPVTEFEGRLISTRLPSLLATMGYETQFDAARTQLDLNGRWTGAPMDFSLARLSGTLGLVMVDGTIPEAQPGAGRLVGLISLSAMPRRLMLDFRDVFSQGLKFDRVEGAFELAGGVARTDGLRLEAPAADITVTGTTDLGARSYDQTVLVEPGVSGTLPVLGGLAGGPAGAAAGLILRSLLERPLQGVGEARYRVTGSWEAPKVELIDARAAEPEDRRLEDEAPEEDESPAPFD